jgi:membrane complex biogenesis BtpA family protein
VILDKTVIGMLHVEALPGTPYHKLPISQIIQHTIEEAEVYLKHGIDTLLIENMHDLPYLKRTVGPEITAALAVIAYEVKKRFDVTLGIQVLAGANKEALACALTAGADFIRVEGFVFAHVADEGFMDGCAGELLRYRKYLAAENVKIFADIKKKHSAHAITADLSIVEAAKAAEFFGADGVIVTGNSTAAPADLMQLKDVKENVSIPVLVGSGITSDNIKEYQLYSDGVIVGSYFKEGGKWQNPLSNERIKKLLSA